MPQVRNDRKWSGSPDVDLFGDLQWSAEDLADLAADFSVRPEGSVQPASTTSMLPPGLPYSDRTTGSQPHFVAQRNNSFSLVWMTIWTSMATTMPMNTLMQHLQQHLLGALMHRKWRSSSRIGSERMTYCVLEQCVTHPCMPFGMHWSSSTSSWHSTSICLLLGS